MADETKTKTPLDNAMERLTKATVAVGTKRAELTGALAELDAAEKDLKKVARAASKPGA